MQDNSGYKDFENRFYPSGIIAAIDSYAKTYRDLSGPYSRKLTCCIFGGDKADTKIPMTSPVDRDINDAVSVFRF